MNLIRLQRYLEHRVLFAGTHTLTSNMESDTFFANTFRTCSILHGIHGLNIRINQFLRKIQQLQNYKLCNGQKPSGASIFEIGWKIMQHASSKGHLELIQHAIYLSVLKLLRQGKNDELNGAMARLTKSKEARVFHKWQHYARLMKNVKNFMHNHMATAERKFFHHWYQYVLKQQELKEKCAILIQRKWNRLQANRTLLRCTEKD